MREQALSLTPALFLPEREGAMSMRGYRTQAAPGRPAEAGEVLFVELQRREDFDPPFPRLPKWRADSMYVIAEALIESGDTGRVYSAARA